MLLTRCVVVGAGVVIICYSAYSASDIPTGVAEAQLEVSKIALYGIEYTAHEIVPPDEGLESIDAGWTVGIDGTFERHVEANVLRDLDRSRNYQAPGNHVLIVSLLDVQMDMAVVRQTGEDADVGIDLSNGNSKNGHRLQFDVAVSLDPIVVTQLDTLEVLHVVERGKEPWELRVRPSLDT